MVGTINVVVKSDETKNGKKIMQVTLTSWELPQLEYDYLDMHQRFKIKRILEEYLDAVVLSYEILSKEEQ